MKNLFDYEKTQSATADLPFGAFKDESAPGQQNGTDIVAAHIQDIAYPLYQVLQLAGVTPNGELEDGNNKTQFIQALTNIGICRHSDKVVYNKSVFVWTILGNDFVLYRSIKDENSAELNDASSWQKILEIGSDNVLKFAVDTNIEIENSVESYLTNCILEIPQNIKYTLEDGTLTIKAGTIITVPYGTTDQSTTYPVGATFLNNNFKVVKTYFNNNKFFVQAEVQADIVSGGGGEPDGSGRTAIINLTSNAAEDYLTDRQVSGDNPTVTQNYSGVYNTTTNRVGKNPNNLTIDYTNVRSFPLLQLIETETEKYGNVKQVFNGMGYIGAAVFVLPGLKWIAPNGKNADGSNNNIEGHLDYVYTEQILNTHVKLLTFYSEFTGELRDVGQGTIFDYVNTVDELQNLGYAYVRTENQMYVNGARSGYPLCAPVARVNGISDNGNLQITDFQFNTTFLVADDQTVLHKYGNETAYGDKTFNGSIIINAHNDTRPVQIITDSNDLQSVCGFNTQVDYAAIPSTTVNGARVISYDKNGQYYGFFQTIAISNVLKSAIGSRRRVGSSDYSSVINACVDQNGNVYGEASTYTANYADSSTKIVTTAYMANHWTTSKATKTSTASKARPAVVVTNYVSGASWYRIWSDGWIEQGGVVTINGADQNGTVTLLKAHANTNYSAIATLRSEFDATRDAGVGAIPSTTNQLIIRNGVNFAVNICWRTAGY